MVHTWDGERHAVLTVTTNKGDYVLDNMRGEILSWSCAGYTWVERQAANNPWTWVSLQSDGAVGPAVATLPAPAKPAPATMIAEIALPAPHPHLDLTALLTLPHLLPLPLPLPLAEPRPAIKVRIADLN